MSCTLRFLKHVWSDTEEVMPFQEIPDDVASLISGGSTTSKESQRRCVDGDCTYKDNVVEDGVTVYEYEGDKSPWQRLFGDFFDVGTVPAL